MRSAPRRSQMTTKEETEAPLVLLSQPWMVPTRAHCAQSRAVRWHAPDVRALNHARSRNSRPLHLHTRQTTANPRRSQIERVSGLSREGMYRTFGAILDAARVPRGERRLFHGSAAAAIRAILRQGFRIVLNKCVFVNVRVCVRACVRLPCCLCMYICMCICMFVRIRVCVGARLHVRACACVRVYVSSCACACASAYFFLRPSVCPGFALRMVFAAAAACARVCGAFACCRMVWRCKLAVTAAFFACPCIFLMPVSQ